MKYNLPCHITCRVYLGKHSSNAGCYCIIGNNELLLHKTFTVMYVRTWVSLHTSGVKSVCTYG